ncbi:MAG: ABC transporter substrate-binding protein [Deltaproteobacteria bacterium]|nr:ABC transporter substrate-binding protein [Deltaproteobacteria bacterium]MBI2539516.1 ABC transporter substrate-binding protein [Deltaproteobacteria bacterium]
MNRTLLYLFLVPALLTVLPPRRAAAEIVHIGISTVGLYELPTEIAKRKGFYRDEGLEVRKVAIRTGLQVAALLAGELDYSTVTGSVLLASVQGIPVKTVMGWFDRPLHLLIARPQIKKLADLRGKKIAVSSIGSIPHAMVREAFAQNGLSPDKDATFLAIGGSSDRLAALAAGSVDATPLDVAYVEKVEKFGFSNVLYLGDVVQLRLGGFAVATEKIAKNPGQIARVIRATLKGVRFLKSHREETLAIMRDYLKLSDTHVDRVYQYALLSLNEEGTVAKASLDNEIRLAREKFKIKEEIAEAKVADWRFVKEIASRR